jgi:hypothetical protein
MKGQKLNVQTGGLPAVESTALLGHELGNVLNGLLGMAELLGESGLNREQRRWLDAIEHSGLQMLALIQPERLVGPGPGLSLQPRMRRVDGVRLLEQILTSHVPAAKARQNRLLLIINPELPRYWDCDPCMVRQLLDNVLGNAIKFTLGGDVLVEATAGSAPQTLALRISDSGPGPGLKRLTDSDFSRQDRSAPSASRCNDRGLGLPICRLIMGSLKGGLHFERRVSGGARVEMSIPGVLNDRAAIVFHPNALFEHLRCFLRLPEPLSGSVGNALRRLGVKCTERKPSPRCQKFCLEITEATGLQHAGCGLCVSPLPGGYPAHPGKEISLPLLESSLGSLLLEMVLEWRSDEINHGKQGSVR